MCIVHERIVGRIVAIVSIGTGRETALRRTSRAWILIITLLWRVDRRHRRRWFGIVSRPQINA